jgi:hypothetical protein
VAIASRAVPELIKTVPDDHLGRYRPVLRRRCGGRVVDIGFDVDGLRRAGDGHRSSAAAAAALSGLLTGIALDARALGTVPHAAAFHGAVVTARDTQARDALQESTRREDGAGRTDAAAGFGASLVTLTTDVARSAAPPGLPLSVAPPGVG